MKYINHFLQSKCAIDMLSLGLFPNAKEITESWGAYAALSRLTQKLDFNDPDINVVCVGDGSTPRTAATFAFRSRWNCISVDPALRSKESWYRINRLTCHKDKIEKIKLDFGDKPVIIMLVHSHAPINACLRNITTTGVRHLITMPCCVDHNINDKIFIGYRDNQILSEKREIKIWQNV